MEELLSFVDQRSTVVAVVLSAIVMTTVNFFKNRPKPQVEKLYTTENFYMVRNKKEFIIYSTGGTEIRRITDWAEAVAETDRLQGILDMAGLERQTRPENQSKRITHSQKSIGENPSSLSKSSST